MSWQNSGFNVHVCEPIDADDRNALECLAHYMIRCQFSQERMTHLDYSGIVNYCSKGDHLVEDVFFYAELKYGYDTDALFTLLYCPVKGFEDNSRKAFA